MKRMDENGRSVFSNASLNHNTVHLTILIRLAKSTRRVRWRLRGRQIVVAHFPFHATWIDPIPIPSHR